MASDLRAPRAKRRHNPSKSPRARHKIIHRLVTNDLIRRVSYEEYRDKVHEIYSGPQGAVLAVCSLVSLHTPMGDYLLGQRKFDLGGVSRILDIGSGAGQIATHLLKYADPSCQITCCDLSHQMLRRARARLKSERPTFVAADMTRLPFADASFDCVTCGYVLEHLPDPRAGLAEISRVLTRGGRMLLMATEDSFWGALTSRLWCCRTYNRAELFGICQNLGLAWRDELWFTQLHKFFRIGGICVSIEKI